jgi:hypothetical protein
MRYFVLFSPYNTVNPGVFIMAANADEVSQIVGIGNFHKTLPHNEFGEVDPDEYKEFACIASSPLGDYEDVALGSLDTEPDADRLVSPQAGRSQEFLRPDPLDMEMLPAPEVRSVSTAAEMVELYPIS